MPKGMTYIVYTHTHNYSYSYSYGYSYGYSSLMPGHAFVSTNCFSKHLQKLPKAKERKKYQKNKQCLLAFASTAKENAWGTIKQKSANRTKNKKKKTIKVSKRFHLSFDRCGMRQLSYARTWFLLGQSEAACSMQLKLRKKIWNQKSFLWLTRLAGTRQSAMRNSATNIAALHVDSCPKARRRRRRPK